jgi:5'-3' exonuclease
MKVDLMSKSFARISEVDASTLMVVDALNLAFRYKHAKSTDFVDDYIRLVESLKKSYKTGSVIIACDKGSSSYRKALYPEYKENRKELQAKQTEQEEKEFLEFFEEFNRTMDAINEKYPVLRFDKVEADDIAAYITKHASKYDVTNIWLISSDRDWDLLVNDSVSRFSYVTRKETTMANWYTHYDVDPANYIGYKCLIGDTGDNIKGVDGIGPKRASSLLKEYSGSIFDIIAALPINSKYKYIQSLNQSKDLLLLNYKIMDLLEFCEEAIGEENIKEIDKVLELL